MKTLVVGLHPHLDLELHRSGRYAAFQDGLAFLREGVLRSFTPNLSTIAVTTCLAERGYDVDYVEMALEFGLPFTAATRAAWMQRVERRLRAERYDNVFFSCVSSAEHLTLKLVAAAVKRVHPHAITGAGSFHANTLRERLLHDVADLDFVFLGDLEGTVDELMGRLASGDVGALADLPNVITRAGGAAGAAAKHAPERPSESRFSYRTCDKYLPLYDTMAAIGMKGCPYTCSFCQEKIVRPGYKKRSPHDVVAEAADNFRAFEERCGHRRIGYGFMEPIFGLDRRWTEAFANEIERSGLEFYWGAQTRVGQLNADELARLGQLGCRVLYYGLENYAPAQLARMDKTRNAASYLATFDGDIARCAANGIIVETNILFGYPGESEETLAENERGMRETRRRYPNTSVNLNLFRPLPSTKGLQDSDLGEDAWLLIPDWWETGILPGVTVIVQPSREVGPERLLRFYESVYDRACYERRGIHGEILAFVERGELPPSALPAVGTAIREQVWRMSRTELREKAVAS
jgi:radical SAM superfamily enzyme YgiQ (UPF0313 family)